MNDYLSPDEYIRKLEGQLEEARDAADAAITEVERLREALLEFANAVALAVRKAETEALLEFANAVALAIRKAETEATTP